MTALPYPTYGIHELYLFPVFQTREAYREATGQEPPPYDPHKPIKSWFDPKAADSPRRKVVYDNVLAIGENGYPLAGPDGKPMLEPLVIDKEQAATVNIPPKKPGTPDQPVTGHEVPVPLRALAPNEELYFQFGGSVAVRNKDLVARMQEGFTFEDRALLHRIAEKLGVSL